MKAAPIRSLSILASILQDTNTVLQGAPAMRARGSFPIHNQCGQADPPCLYATLHAPHILELLRAHMVVSSIPELIHCPKTLIKWAQSQMWIGTFSCHRTCPGPAIAEAARCWTACRAQSHMCQNWQQPSAGRGATLRQSPDIRPQGPPGPGSRPRRLARWRCCCPSASTTKTTVSDMEVWPQGVSIC
jgi:hypothetical protein